MKAKIGDAIRLETEENLLKKGERKIGKIVKTTNSTEHPYLVDFDETKAVPLFASEIKEILTKEKYPEEWL